MDLKWVVDNQPWLSVILASTSATIALLGLFINVANAARLWPRALFRIAGLTGIAVGGLAMYVPVQYTIRTRPASLADVPPAIAMTFAFGALCILGAFHALRKLADRNTTRRLQRVASQLGSAAQVHTKQEAPTIPVRLTTAEGRDVPMALSAALESMTEPVTLLEAPPGSGKTVTMRDLARKENRKLAQGRKRSHIYLYVDLTAIIDETFDASADNVQKIVLDYAAAGDALLRRDLSAAISTKSSERITLLLDNYPASEEGGKLGLGAFVSAVLDLTSSSDRHRSVITLDEASMINPHLPVIRMSDPSERDVEKTILRLSMPRKYRDSLLRLFMKNWRVHELMRSPEVLSALLTPEDFNAFPTSGIDVLREVVERRSSAPVDTALLEEGVDLLSTSGPSAAWLGPMLVLSADPDRSVRLRQSALVKSHRTGSLSFASRRIQDYFVVTAILQGCIDTRTLRRWLEHDSMQLAVSTAIAEGGAQATLVAEQAAEMLVLRVNESPNTLEFIPPFLSEEDPQHQEHIAAPYRSSTAILRLLYLLADSIPWNDSIHRKLLQTVSGLADRVVVSALLVGTRSNELEALPAIPLCSGRVGSWAARRVLALNSERALVHLSGALAAAPHVFERLDFHARLETTGRFAWSFGGGPRKRLQYERVQQLSLYCSDGPGPDGKESWPNSVRLGLRALQVCAVYSVILFLLLSDTPRAMAAASILLIAPVCLFGSVGFVNLRTPRLLGFTAGVVIFFTTAFMTIVHFAVAVAALIGPPALSPQGIVASAINFYLCTWVASVLWLILRGEPAAVRDWLLPQRIAVAPGSSLIKDWVATRKLEFSRLWRTTPDAWGSSGWRQYGPEVKNGEVGGERLLRLLAGAGSSELRSWLLDALLRAPAPSLQRQLDTLEDLERALAVVNRFVPSTTAKIPPAVWSLAQWSSPNFATWLRDFDSRHPGALSSMAADEADLMAQIVQRARHQ